MSFRSRSHTKPVAPPRRASSLTRSTGSSNGYQPTSNGRPYSVHGSALNYPSSQGNYLYGSNQNLRMASGDYYGNGGSTDYRRSSYGSTYTSPYVDRYSGSNGASGYTSAYKDRNYYNPYTSYDNGVTTASLSIPGSSMKRDYGSRNSNLLSISSAGLGGSSTSLMNPSINETVANIGRSQSLREHERKSRTRKCKEAVKAAVPDTLPMTYDATLNMLSSGNKSLSSLSLQSEGYEVN